MKGEAVMSYGFSFDASRCCGCMACVVACMDQNNTSENGRPLREVVTVEQGTYPDARIFFVSLACFHCADAPCLHACPSHAIRKNNGTGLIDVDLSRCIGCHVCAMVCPFGAPRFSTDGKMHKCHLCIERLEQGRSPACVHTCPTRALGFGTDAQLAKHKAKKASIRMVNGCLPDAS